jgi:uncharacterized protein
MSELFDSKKVIANIVAGIQRRINPERIILFGSRARGRARENSDFDILIVANSDEPRYRRSVPIYAELANLPVEIDAVVYTPEEIAEWSNVSESLVSTALREGVVLYEG